jgi:hypothetical protein
MDPVPDQSLQQLHMYVCIMIELRSYALSRKVMQIHNLCCEALRDKAEDFPIARNVSTAYSVVDNPHNMPPELAKNNYTDKYVNDVNGILEEIMLQDEPDEIKNAFNKLTDLLSP